ncbi:MAG TPA: hypothetical protein VLM91_21240, partial [Candidatus Methylomirabilis sp.]|nr:hypothetical protein [Candidatus Methylomirabilis sp.]
MKSRSVMAMSLILAQLWVASGAMAAAIPQPPNASPFNIIGFIQRATLDAPGDVLAGGTVTVNGTTVVIPRNTIVQMPNTYVTWAELFSMAPSPWGPGSGPRGEAQTGLSLTDVNPTTGKPPLTTYEITLFGNRIVDPTDGTDKYIAGLVTINQEALNFGQGFVNFIDYAKGELHIGGMPKVASATDTRVQINDPVGRFGLQHSPDPRFTADTDNATVHAKTGYPMCIPRTDPAVADDSLCPKANRPLDAAGNPTGNFSMPPQPAPPARLAAGNADSTKQAPIMVGDYVEYIGTLQVDAAGQYLSAFQIIANVGIYTAPGNDPAYIVLEDTILGVGGNPIPGVPQENNLRIVIVGFTTDPSRPVDAFAVDVDPCTGQETERVISTLGALIPEAIPLGRVRFAQLVSNANPPTRNWRLRYRGSSVQISANGLVAMQYSLPVNEYVFPENTTFGDSTLLAVPLNFQDFPFLALGSGPWRDPSGPIVGQLKPFPLVEIPGMSPAIPTPPVCSPVAVKTPTVHAGLPQTVQAATQAVLTATGNDPNVPPLPLTFTFAQTGGPSVALSANSIAAVSGAASVTFTAPTLAAGAPPLTLTFNVTASNGVAVSPPSTTFVTVGNPAARDTVTITAATYDTGRGTLTVNATSTDTRGTATLFLTTSTGFGPTQMTNGSLGAYSFTQRGIFPTPFTVTVLSSEGGSA